MSGEKQRKSTVDLPVGLARRVGSACIFAAATVVVVAGGCGSNHSSSGFEVQPPSTSGGSSGGGAGASSGSGGGSYGDASILTLGDSGAGATATCNGGKTAGWKCSVDAQCGSSPTTLTGKVFDPAGQNPLYNVVVFIPNVVANLPTIQPGTHTCNTCDVSIGDYVVATTTDASGKFTLKGVPTGSDVPVTVQIGKWRRTTTVNIPKSCQTTAAADGTLRLPTKRSEGDLPQMAVLTGGCDDLGCFMKGMGIDASEFSAPQAGGRLDVYQGVGGGGGFLGGGGAGGAATLSTGTAGNCTTASCPLWSAKSALEYYDIVLLSCECGENNQTKPTAGKQALHDWLDEGGKVFASHYHYTWFRNSPAADFQGVATWAQSGNNDGAQTSTTPYDIDTTFPKGATFGTWLGNVNALNSAGPPPDILLSPVADSVATVNPPTTRWIYDSASPNDVKYMSFETPIGGVAPPPDAGAEAAKNYCGKAVFTDLHTAGSGRSMVSTIPDGCTDTTLSPQQKALEFLFFDLSACVTNDNGMPPMIPPPQ
jgi:hypothetical protein